MRKKILIVGGCGYIGGFMADMLSLEGHDITVYDSLMYEDHYLKNIKLIVGDVRDKRRLEKLVNDFDVVVWLAAIVGDGACGIDPFLTESINVQPVKWLADYYTGQIVFTSTCSVYGINDDLIDETAETNPLSVYARTKLEAEQYLLDRADDPLIFRLGTLHGLGDQHSRIRFDLVANVLAMRATLGMTLKVFGGEQWRPLLHVKDVTTAVSYGINAEISGLFNLHDENLTIRCLAETICGRVPGAGVEYEDMKTEDQRNYRVRSDSYRALGWSPQFSLRKGIDEISTAVREGRIRNVTDALYSNVDYLKTVRMQDLVPAVAK